MFFDCYLLTPTLLRPLLCHTSMFEPLRELLPEDPQALIDDARVLGEKAGRLYGSRSAAAYAALGGATYRPLQCVNEGVIGWAEASDKGGSGVNGRVSSSSSLQRSATGNEDGALLSWVSAVLSWVGSFTRTSRRRACRSATQQQRCRHCGKSGLRAALMKMCVSTPHILPHLLHCAATVAAFFLPSVRMLCPSALPDVSRLLEARQSSKGGPERVTAISFHPLYMWLAVAVDAGGADGSARVVVYNVAEETVACVLSHAFQKDVNWLQWKPYAVDVLAVGCRGGVLLWSIGGGGGAAASAAADVGGFGQREATARALFYRTQRGFTVTGGAFSNRDGSMLACASMTDTQLHLLNVRQPPFSPQACVAVVVPTIDGGLHEVVFDDEDLFMVCAVCEHPSLALVRCAVPAAGSSATAGVAPTVVGGVHQSTIVPIPAPVHRIARASGLGQSLFFLATKNLEGVLLARINPYLGVEVVSMISTGLYRGVGGCVTHFACSRRRLWMQTETNYLVVCRYGQRGGAVTLLPVGVAAIEAVALASFAGCTTGSLVAVLERDGTISMIPSYHS